MRVVTCWCSRPVLVDWGIRGGGAQVYRETSSVVPIHGQIAGTPYLTTRRNDARTTSIPASGKGGGSERDRSFGSNYVALDEGVGVSHAHCGDVL